MSNLSHSAMGYYDLIMCLGGISADVLEGGPKCYAWAHGFAEKEASVIKEMCG